MQAVSEDLVSLIERFQGGVIWTCLPGALSRGRGQREPLDGLVATGESAARPAIRNDAATLSF